MNSKQRLTEVYRSILRLVGRRGWGKIYPISILNNWFTSWALRHLKTNTAIVHGHKMHLDANDSLGLSLWGTWEPFETELIQKLVRPGDVAVDVGANIGYYTLLLARCVGDAGRVFAFEPAPSNLAILKENILQNGYKNVVIEPLAASDQNGNALLSLSDENQGDHRLNRSDASLTTVTVPTIALDEYFRKSGQTIRLVKMDVQGAELRALSGMRELLATQENWILILEFFPSALEEMGDDPKRMLDLLHEEGFTMHEIIESSHLLPPIDTHWYSRDRFGKIGFTNLLCIRGDVGIKF